MCGSDMGLNFFKIFIFVQIEMTVEWPGAQKLKRISQKIYISPEKV